MNEKNVICLHRWEHWFFSKDDRPGVRCAICHTRGEPYATLQEMKAKPEDSPMVIIGRVVES